MKCHKYKIEDYIIVVNPLHDNAENLKGKTGFIYSFVYGETFDYEVYMNGEFIKFKESEIALFEKEIKIALTSKMRAGKDTIAQYAIDNYGFTRFAFGDGIRETCKKLFPDQMKGGKNRHLLQKLGQTMRYKFDENVWVNYCFREIEAEKTRRYISPIITDLRQPNEYTKCKEENFIIIKVETNDEIRLQRMNENGDNFTLDDLNHETEQYINSFEYDYLIKNNDSLEEVYKQFDLIMSEIINKGEIK